MQWRPLDKGPCVSLYFSLLVSLWVAACLFLSPFGLVDIKRSSHFFRAVARPRSPLSWVLLWSPFRFASGLFFSWTKEKINRTSPRRGRQGACALPEACALSIFFPIYTQFHLSFPLSFFFGFFLPLPILFLGLSGRAAVANDRPTNHAIRPNLCAVLGQAMTDAALGLPQQRPGGQETRENDLGAFFFFIIKNQTNSAKRKEYGIATEKVNVCLSRSWRRCRRETTRGRRFGQMRRAPGRVRARQETAARRRWRGPAPARRAQTRYGTRPRR